MSAVPEEKVHHTAWAIILSDWKRSGAQVRLFTRGGAALGPGRIESIGGVMGPEVQLVGRVGGHLAKWDADLSEIAAIEAVAP